MIASVGVGYTGFDRWTLALDLRAALRFLQRRSGTSAVIILTLALALALTRDEAVWAMRGFAIAVMLSLTVIGLSHVIALPDLSRIMTHFAAKGRVGGGATPGFSCPVICDFASPLLFRGW